MSEKRSVQKRTPGYEFPDGFDVFVWGKPEVLRDLCLDSFFVVLGKPKVFQYFCFTDAHPQELLSVVTPSGSSSRALFSSENGMI